MLFLKNSTIRRGEPNYIRFKPSNFPLYCAKVLDNTRAFRDFFGGIDGELTSVGRMGFGSPRLMAKEIELHAF